MEGRKEITDVGVKIDIERRRAELAQDIQEARREYQAGNARPITPDELMEEIL
jgi:hypothetical protein